MLQNLNDDLPRQARDKCRRNSKRERDRFVSGACVLRLPRDRELRGGVRCAAAVLPLLLGAHAVAWASALLGGKRW